MARALKFNLRSQSQIVKEGDIPVEKERVIPVGIRKATFFIPDLEEALELGLEKGAPKIQKVVDQINQYIENIADDYFLLGLHLISLHHVLKKSGLTTEQVKSWYTENINMPYSSAMQCKKVAEAYREQPDLIGKYTASGAYLLSSCSQEERDEIWNEARRDKDTATVRELRETLKRRREQVALEEPVVEDVVKEALPTFRMTEVQIHESLLQLTSYSKNLTQCANPDEQVEMRHALIEAIQDLITKIEETV
ncbi:hypothetical protein WDW89_16660 [Deltaproteobacteria bacterium TL4]